MNYDSPFPSAGLPIDPIRLSKGYFRSSENNDKMFASEMIDSTVKYGFNMKSIVNMMHIAAGIPSECLIKHKKNVENCIFPINIIPTIKTPIFHMQVCNMNYLNHSTSNRLIYCEFVIYFLANL
jgi:hypothetical protein